MSPWGLLHNLGTDVEGTSLCLIAAGIQKLTIFLGGEMTGYASATVSRTQYYEWGQITAKGFHR